MPNTKAIDCPNCGQATLRETMNRTLICPNCGAEYEPPPTIVDRIMDRDRRVDRFTTRARGMADLKASEEAASQQRAQELWAKEGERQELLTTQVQERDRQEQKMMRIIFAVIAVVGLALLIILIASAPR